MPKTGQIGPQISSAPIYHIGTIIFVIIADFMSNMVCRSVCELSLQNCVETSPRVMPNVNTISVHIKYDCKHFTLPSNNKSLILSQHF